MENFKAKFMQPKTLEEKKKTTEQIESIQRKINDENKVEETRRQLGVENRDTQIQSFIRELPHKDGYIDFYQLQNKGGGGTHYVFIDPQNPAFVIKLNRDVLEKTIKVDQPELSPETRQQAEQYIDSENRKNEQLYQYFGQKHCLRDQVITQKIRVAHCGVAKNIESVIVVQEASSVFLAPGKMSFGSEYAEKKLANQDKNTYDKMNKALLGNEKFDENDFLKLHEELKSIFELAEKDENFADSVREFLLRFKKYFETSSRFIDLVGQDNVVFFQQDGKWSFILKSVLKDETRQDMEKALKVLEQNPNQLNSDDELRNILMNSLTLTRILNAIGLKTGVGKIVDTQLNGKQLENLDKIKFNKEVEAEGKEL